MIDPIASITFLPLKLSRNVIEHIIDPASPDLPDRSPLAYFLRIDVPEFPQSATMVELTTMEGREKPPVTVAGATTYEGAFFQIEQLLDGFLSLQKPAMGQRTMSAIATLTMPYRLCERIDPLPGMSNCPQAWVMKAGLSDVDFGGWGDRFFDTYQQQARRFLTWQPDEKLVGPSQPEFLYFLLNISPLPGTITLRCDWVHEDGYTNETILLQLQNAQTYQVLCVPVGPALLLERFQAPDQSPIVSYRVWLSDADNMRLSEVRTYRIDGRYRQNERYVIFNNSLGGFDTLRLIGTATELLHMTRTSAERERAAGAGSDFSELYVIENLGERTLTVSTGYLDRNAASTLRYFDELMMAQEWYLATERGHVALELLTTDLLDVEAEPDLVARQFAFRLVAAETNFSALPAAPVTPSRATGWRGTSFRPILDGFGKRTGQGAPARLRKYFLDSGADVKPLVEKPNTTGDPDYLKPTPAPDFIAGTTPFPSTLISRSGSFNRTGCAVGQAGGPATVTIAAARYGGETDGAADVLAEAEFRSLDTQAYADANGTCVAVGENYAWNVPAGHWHYRSNLPGSFEVYHKYNADADMGNAQAVQDRGGPGQAGAYIFRPGTNDLDFPITDKWWYYIAPSVPGGYAKVSVFRNGQLVFAKQHDYKTEAGYEIYGIMTSAEFNIDVTPQSGDRWYLKYEVV